MRRVVFARGLCLMIASALAACGTDGGPSGEDAGPRSDASAEIDAGVADDAGLDPGADAGAETDAGVADDAGLTADAGVLDAGAPSDGGPVSMPCAASGACDPFDPAACGDQVCRPGTSGIACYDAVASPAPEGAPCSAPDQCARGTVCLSFGGGPFLCERMCAAGSIGACGEGRACTGAIGDPCVQACRPIPARCDVYAQDCASAADTCTLVLHPETDAPYTGCRPAGVRARGETCGGMDGTCGRDLLCIRTSGVTACRTPCDPSAASPGCPAGEACTGVARTWGVGYCLPM